MNKSFLCVDIREELKLVYDVIYGFWNGWECDEKSK